MSCKIYTRNWKLRLWKWLAPESVHDHFMWQAEHKLLGVVSKNHTVIGEKHAQRLWNHPDGTCDVVLTSGEQSVTIQLPPGRDWLVLGNESAAQSHYDLSPSYRMQNAAQQQWADMAAGRWW